MDVLRCAFCDAEYPPGTPPTQHEALTAHVLVCPKHPMREVERQRDEALAVIARHDLCHNLHGKVDARAFADGCAQEQRRLYGCAPDADALEQARTALRQLAHQVELALLAGYGCESVIGPSTEGHHG